jgi:hypothetical protein
MEQRGCLLLDHLEKCFIRKAGAVKRIEPQEKTGFNSGVEQLAGSERILYRRRDRAKRIILDEKYSSKQKGSG